jgi:UDP:flavonoid glycosyltransferase YjiC (YdhE family)
MKILIVPGANALSHFIKSVSIKKSLEQNGHEVKIAISRQYKNFALMLKEDFFIIPNIQEIDHSSFPTLDWFKNETNVCSCISAERKLLTDITGFFRG